MAEGRSNHAIAEALGLETKTVEGHVRTIFSKLGLEPDAADHRRVMAVLRTSKPDGGCPRSAGVSAHPPEGYGRLRIFRA
jgi:hypothetical protein